MRAVHLEQEKEAISLKEPGIRSPLWQNGHFMLYITLFMGEC